MFDRTQQDGGVLRAETYLTPDHRPEEPVGREAELDRIVEAVEPLTRRRRPENLLVHGPAGVGKSTCVNHVFDRLETETSVKAVYINCWQYNTRASLLTELLIQLGYPAPRKGKPVDALLSKLREWLDKNRGVAVALDEFDQLDAGTEVVYDLQLVDDQAENRLGLVLVSNQHARQLELDPRSQSRLNCQTLQFEPYAAHELEAILQDRVERGFRPGAVDDNVVEAIAETVAERSGDCREALSTLLKAGRVADRAGKRSVDQDVLDEVSE